MLRNCSTDEINVYKESNRPICTIKLHICCKVRKYGTENKFKLLIFYDENWEVASVCDKRSKSNECRQNCVVTFSEVKFFVLLIDVTFIPCWWRNQLLPSGTFVRFQQRICSLFQLISYTMYEHLKSDCAPLVHVRWSSCPCTRHQAVWGSWIIAVRIRSLLVFTVGTQLTYVKKFKFKNSRSFPSRHNLSAPASLCSGKSPRTHWVRDLKVPRAGLDVSKEENSIFHAGKITNFLQSPLQTAVAILQYSRQLYEYFFSDDS